MAHVFLLASIAVGGEHLPAGEVVEVDAALAADLIGTGRALAEAPPEVPPAPPEG